MKPRQRWLGWLVAAYAGLLAALSLLPSGGDGPQWDDEVSSLTQNALHVPAYTALALLVWLAASPRRRVGVGRLALVGVACLAYGGALELAQSWVPGRMASGRDALLNLAGVVLGMLAAVAWQVRAARQAPGQPADKH